MFRKLAIVLLALVALVLGIATRYALTTEDRNKALPEPRLVDLNGHQHQLSDWRGKILVVNFWATWCPPCREEMPMFAALQSQLAGKGVQFVGIAIDDPNEVRDFLRHHPVNYPILVGGDTLPAWADSLGNELSALPFTVIFDQTGRTIYRHTGLLTREVLLEKLVLMVDSQPAGRE